MSCNSLKEFLSLHFVHKLIQGLHSSDSNAAVEQCPRGGAICLELLVLPAAERRGGSGVRCSTAAFSPSEARGERGIKPPHLSAVGLNDWFCDL